MFPLIPLALGGLSFLSGAFKNRDKRTSQNSTSTSSSAFGPTGTALNDRLLQMIQSRLTGGPADITGYSAEGIKGINRTFDAGGQGLSADLTARGLSDSPAAVAPLSRFAGARSGSISAFQNTLPLLQREWQADDLGLATRLLGLQPQTTTTTGTATGTQFGQPLAGGLAELGTILGDLMAKGAFGRKPQA